MSPQGKVALLALVLALWVMLAAALVVSDIPWSNEAWSAIPALNLATHGSMGTTVLASKGTWLSGLERHTYWIMPLHSLVEAGWYKLIGFTLFRQRSLSVLFGGVALVSWFVVVKRLSGAYSAAILAVLIIGFERNFLNAAANGRMDMMAAALGASGLAAFVELRARAPRTSLWASHSLTAAAVLTHPCGVLFVVALLIVMLYERPKLHAADMAVIALPYVIGVGLWGLYIAQAPRDFESQFFGNVSGFAGEYLHRERFNGIRAPWRAVWQELRLRYLLPFGFGELRTVTGAVTAVWLCLNAAAASLALLAPRLRSEPAVRVFASCAAAVFLIMALFEGMKFQHYLVYSLPFFGALTAVVAARFLRPTYAGFMVGVAIAAMVVPQTAGVVRHFARNPLRTEYLSRKTLLAGAFPDTALRLIGSNWPK